MIIYEIERALNSTAGDLIVLSKDHIRSLIAEYWHYARVAEDAPTASKDLRQVATLLTPLGAEIFLALANEPGETLTWQQLMDCTSAQSEGSVHTMMNRMRKTLRRVAPHIEIGVRRGSGYRLVIGPRIDAVNGMEKCDDGAYQ